jgi:hypothetical protein
MHKTDDISQMRIQDKQINNPQVIAEAFNKYFIIDAGKMPADNLKRQEAIKLLRESKNDDILEMKLISTTGNEKKHVTESFKSKNSAGYKGISCRILKYSIHAIAKPLSHICNASLNQGIYHDRLKFAIVMPIYKKGNKADVCNYSPTSLITTFTEILEKLCIIDEANTWT